MALKLEDGSVSAPSMNFASDADTGLYYTSTGIVNVAANGTQATRFTSSGEQVNQFYSYLSDGNVGFQYIPTTLTIRTTGHLNPWTFASGGGATANVQFTAAAGINISGGSLSIGGTVGVNTTNLRTATGSQTGGGGGSHQVTMNDYSFFPSIATWAGQDAVVTWTNGASDPGNTVGRISFGNTQQYAVRWRYVTASDNPRIWVIVNQDGTLCGVWEAEDPVNQLNPNDNTNPFEGCEMINGQTIVQVPIPTKDELLFFMKSLNKDSYNVAFQRIKARIEAKAWEANWFIPTDMYRIGDINDLDSYVKENNKRVLNMERMWIFRELVAITPAVALKRICTYSFNDKRLHFMNEFAKSISPTGLILPKEPVQESEDQRWWNSYYSNATEAEKRLAKRCGLATPV